MLCCYNMYKRCIEVLVVSMLPSAFEKYNKSEQQKLEWRPTSVQALCTGKSRVGLEPWILRVPLSVAAKIHVLIVLGSEMCQDRACI